MVLNKSKSFNKVRERQLHEYLDIWKCCNFSAELAFCVNFVGRQQLVRRSAKRNIFFVCVCTICTLFLHISILHRKYEKSSPRITRIAFPSYILSQHYQLLT